MKGLLNWSELCLSEILIYLFVAATYVTGSPSVSLAQTARDVHEIMIVVTKRKVSQEPVLTKTRERP